MKKPKVGIVKAIVQCFKYSKLNEDRRTALRDERLRQMVAFARENSSYYKKLYKDIKADFKLTDLPIVNKINLMANWNEWVTDQAITLEGRNDNVVTFTQDGQLVKLPPLAIYVTLKEIHELRRFQFIAYSDNHSELRIEPIEGITKQEAFQKAKLALENFFLVHELKDITISLSDKEPKQHSKSGKFQHIVLYVK